MSEPVPASDREHAGLSTGLLTLIAVATGAVVANLYYAQPLLHQIGRDFGEGPGATSLIVTLTQLGYAAGLLLVVPLGDLLPRRRLVSRIFVVASVALVGCAAAPGLWWFGAASVVVGAASVAGQVMIPLAADLAEPARRGRVVGRVMSGLLIGILLARTVSGAMAEAAGWRSVYYLSAGAMLVFAAVLRRYLPAEAPRPHSPYRRLVATSLALLVQEPLLRRRAWHGACAFAAFSVLWTTLAFVLAASPYRYSNGIIGLFGLLGVAGVIAANLAGRLADAQRATVSTVVAGVLIVVAFAVMVPGTSSLAALIVGVLVLDAGTQGMQITNQAIIYALRPDARSRINSAYMVCYFAGGALGSVLAGTVYAAYGWRSVCALGAGFGVLTILMAIIDRARPVPLRSTSATLAS